MIYYWRKYRTYILLVLTIMLIICGIIYKNTVYDKQVFVIEEKDVTQGVKEEPIEEEITIEMITVYVCGSVESPSNVTLPEGSRVEDAVKLAGGVTESADLNAINMAQKLSDADMVYVPQKGETASAVNTGSAGAAAPKAKGKLNINKATASELDTLPGIGPSTAEKIIQYRKNNGGFSTVEEINNVSGIGDSKYNEIKDLITAN